MVRLQAAARGLLARRRVREMRGLQLPLLQIALRCAKDLELIRGVGYLGYAVPPTGVGIFFSPRAATSKSATSAVGGGGAPLLVILHRKPSTLLCGADQQPSGGEKAGCHRQERTA